jgi:predicted flavoprotein YhiN
MRSLLSGPGYFGVAQELSNSNLNWIVQSYGTVRDWMEPMARAFPPAALVAWVEAGAADLRRVQRGVFPQALKASPPLRAWGGTAGGAGRHGAAAPRVDRLGISNLHSD